VTFYTCCYNQEKYVKKTIESVLSQTKTDWEYIVIDDCSTDGSLNTIVKYISQLPENERKKIQIISNPQNIGLPASCNIALKLARGQYICRIDSDDVLKKDFLNEMTTELEAHANAGGLVSSYVEIDQNGNEIMEIRKNKMHPGCALLSRWYANEVKFQEGLKFMEGKEFFNRFTKFHEIKFIDKVLWEYRRHPDQKTQQKDFPGES